MKGDHHGTRDSGHACGKGKPIHSHRILALDLGTTTGWAVRNDRCRILQARPSSGPRRFDGGGMRYLRFEQLARRDAGRSPAASPPSTSRRCAATPAPTQPTSMAGSWPR